jgi:hypothetical protein
MDFTYPFAFIMGLAFSIIASLVVVVVMKQIPRKLRRYLVLAVAAAVLSMSVSWKLLWDTLMSGGQLDMPFWFFPLDIGIIFIMGSLGALLGSMTLRLRPKSHPQP